MQLSRYVDIAWAVFADSTPAVAEVDTADCEGVMFIGVPMSTANKVWSLAIKYGATTTGFVNCASTHTHTTTAANHDVVVTDVYKPAARWVGGTFNSSASDISCYLLAIKYGLRKPVTDFSSTTNLIAATGGIKRAVSPTSAT